MDKNSVIGFILIAAIFIGFTFFQSRQARKRAELQAQLDSVALAQSVEAQLAEAERIASMPDSIKTLPGNVQAIYKDSLLETASRGEAQSVVLENGKLRIEFTTKGAQPYSVQVKDYTNFDGTPLYLFRAGGAAYSFSVYAGEYIRTQDFNFEVAEQTDSSVVMRLPFTGGGYIEQRYVLHADSYQVDNLLSFVDMGAVIPRNVSALDMDFELTMPRMEKGYKN